MSRTRLNTPIQRLTALKDLYDNGFLCACDFWVDPDEDDYAGDGYLVHNQQCEGRERVKKLLSFEAPND